MKNLNRRQFIAVLAAGGVLTAEGLWMPGAKLISIPKYATGGRFEVTGQLDCHFNDPELYKSYRQGGLLSPGRMILADDSGRRIEMTMPDVRFNAGDLVNVEHGYADEAQRLFEVVEVRAGRVFSPNEFGCESLIIA